MFASTLQSGRDSALAKHQVSSTSKGVHVLSTSAPIFLQATAAAIASMLIIQSSYSTASRRFGMSKLTISFGTTNNTPSRKSNNARPRARMRSKHPMSHKTFSQTVMTDESRPTQTAQSATPATLTPTSPSRK